MTDTHSSSLDVPLLYDDHDQEAEKSCCNAIIISSKGLLADKYPHILGEYKVLQNTTYPASYKLARKQKLFLTKPGRGYTWGVARSVEATWGYIRSTRVTPCPATAGPWRIYNKNTLRWNVDNTLRLVCV